MRYIVLLFICIITSNLNATDYKLTYYHPVDTRAFAKLAINDKGKILSFSNNNGYMIIDPNEGEHIIDIDTYFPDITGFNIHSNFTAIRHLVAGNSIPYLYNYKTGIEYLDIFQSRNAHPIDINDNNNIIGYYQLGNEIGKKNQRPFLRLIEKDGRVRIIDLGVGSDLTQSSSQLLSISDVKLTSINNKDQILGYFLGSKLNHFGEIESSGYFPFVYDLYNIEILPIVEKEVRSLSQMQINDDGMILIPRDGKTEIWRKNDYEFERILIEDFRFIAFNDSGTILGRLMTKDSHGVGQFEPVIWKDGKIIHLGYENVDYSLITDKKPGYISMIHPVEFVDINNDGQILCRFSFGSEYCIGILEQTEE